MEKKERNLINEINGRNEFQKMTRAPWRCDADGAESARHGQPAVTQREDAVSGQDFVYLNSAKRWG